jgi:hypothetical protein
MNLPGPATVLGILAILAIIGVLIEAMGAGQQAHARHKASSRPRRHRH